MKNRILFTFCAVLLSIGAMAQSGVKIGFTNADYILSAMPESQEIEQQLSEYEKKFTSQMQSKYQELQEKYAAYQQGAAAMTDDMRREREMELQNLQNSLQKFQQDAESAIMRKQQELLEPVYDKIQNAIDKVAEENGYTHVLRAEAMLYVKNDKDDISNLVLERLGVEPPADN